MISVSIFLFIAFIIFPVKPKNTAREGVLPLKLAILLLLNYAIQSRGSGEKKKQIKSYCYWLETNPLCKLTSWWFFFCNLIWTSSQSSIKLIQFFIPLSSFVIVVKKLVLHCIFHYIFGGQITKFPSYYRFILVLKLMFLLTKLQVDSQFSNLPVTMLSVFQNYTIFPFLVCIVYFLYFIIFLENPMVAANLVNLLECHRVFRDQI